jgi:hypothetical protein
VYGFSTSTFNCTLHGEPVPIEGKFRDVFKRKEREIIGICDRKEAK